jgi:integrase/recombinase XerD
MAMRIKRHPNGIFYFIYYDPEVQYDRKISLGTKNEKEAQDILETQKAKYKLGLPLDIFTPVQSSKKFSVVIDEYLKYKKMTYSTTKNYIAMSRKFIAAVKDKPLSQYARKDIYDFIDYCQRHGYAEGTIKKETSFLHSIFNYAVDVDYIDKNIVKVYQIKEKEDVKTIPLEDFNNFLEFIKDDYKDLFFYLQHAYMLALRGAEGIYLMWEFVDLENEKIKIRNNKRSRFDTLPMIHDLKNYYLNLRPPAKGKIHPFEHYYDIMNLYKKVKAEYEEEKKTKYPYTIKMLRATRCSQLIAAGISIYDLMRFMRHKNIQTTEKYYAKFNLEEMKERMNHTLISSKKSSKEGSLKLVNFF